MRRQPLAKPPRAKRWRRLILGIALAALACLLLDFCFYPWNAPLPGGTAANRNENGLWLRYTWYFGQHSDAEVAQLGRDLTQRQIHYAYFHVRYIGKSGNLRFRYPEAARRLNATLHRSAPDVKSIAWIYVGNTRGTGSIKDLSDPEHRRRMVAGARFLVTDCGFDGVQWDYEICPDGDAGLPALLAETRAALPPGKILSVATALDAPGVTTRLGYGWSDAYFGALAHSCDQIAVMGYDSGLYLPRAYVSLMREQVLHVCPAVRRSNPQCRVLIGVPTYGAGGLSHLAHAENLPNAIRGVREGYQSLSPSNRAVFAGIAPFADYTTDAEEWRQYQTMWLENSP